MFHEKGHQHWEKGQRYEVIGALKGRKRHTIEMKGHNCKEKGQKCEKRQNIAGKRAFTYIKRAKL